MGFWAHVFLLLSLPGLGIVQAKAFVPITCWASVLVSLLHGHGPFSH